MNYPNRRQNRLNGYDYSSENKYFVTICTDNRNQYFWTENRINSFGRIAENELPEICNHFKCVQVDKYVVMPNHIHLILTIGCKPELKLQQPLPTLSTVIGQYKSAVSRKIHLINPKITVWQKSFHDRIIRNEAEYLKLWKYIDENTIPFMFD